MAGKYGGLVLVLVSLLLLQGGVQLAAAAVWNVGDAKGWTFGVQSWPNSPSFKPFREGDVLVFKYDASAHNVVVVDDFGFGTCTTHPANAKVYSSGNDRITLTRGENNFISGKAGDCEKGLKITVFVRP
uniref:Uncharacterized protein n=1 Tax=Avena sativa TaxID=4498 RepID=A0ACD5UAJ8_AVESA